MKITVDDKQYFGSSENNTRKLADSKILDGVNLENLELKATNRLGFGYYGNVYSLKDKSGNTSENYVVKKIMLNVFEEKAKSWFKFNFGSVVSKEDMFLREVKTIAKLQKWNIVPRIYYADKSQLLYVMDRMDYTLYYLLKRADNPKSRAKSLTPEMGTKLLDLVKKYFNVPIFHTDLHRDNIMWSERLGEFRIIDWGYYRTLPVIDGNNTKLNKTSKLYKEKIGESLEMNDRILKSLWNYSKTRTLSKHITSIEKRLWEKLLLDIKEYINTEFPNNTNKYMRYLNSKWSTSTMLKDLGLKGGSIKKTKKVKINKKIDKKSVKRLC